jgi:hypothetical protein
MNTAKQESRQPVPLISHQRFRAAQIEAKAQGIRSARTTRTHELLVGFMASVLEATAALDGLSGTGTEDDGAA